MVTVARGLGIGMALLRPARSSKLLRLMLKTAASEPKITINWVLFGTLFGELLRTPSTRSSEKTPSTRLGE
jgi:hypothetical protein